MSLSQNTGAEKAKERVNRTAPAETSSRNGRQPGKRVRKRQAVEAALLAAYEAGKLLNQLDWHLQQAWLLLALDSHEASEHYQAVFQILTDLPARVNPAVAAIDQERLCNFVLGKRDEWERYFRSPGHRSEIESTADFVKYELSQEFADIDPRRLREEFWADALRMIRNFPEDVYAAVAAILSEHSRQALALGRWIDRGIHPREVYRDMSRSVPQELTDPPPFLGVNPFQVVTGMEPPSTSSHDSPCTPILRKVTAGEFPPEQGWFEGVCFRWDELGLAPSLRAIITEVREENQIGSAASESLITLVKWIDDRAREGLRLLAKALATPSQKISAEDRTKAMTLKVAAKRMGYTGPKAVEQPRAAIDTGAIRCEHLTRQQHIFSKRDFPVENHSQLI
jgi:hypothetical protein